jgi:hypothetical protein
MRNEMSARETRTEQKAIISEWEETTMKVTTFMKATVFIAALGLACLLPATAHAQAEISPDFYELMNTETMAVQPVLVATTAGQAETSPDFYELTNTETMPVQPAQLAATTAKDDFHGMFSLPYDVKCSGKSLKSGKYLLSVKSDGRNRILTIHRQGELMNIRVREIPGNPVASRSALLVRKSGEGRILEAVYVQQLNALLYLDTNESVTLGRMERLPIS